MARNLSDKIHAVDNYSWPGNNIDSIQHIVVTNRSMFQRDDYVVIGIPPIERLTVFDHMADARHVVRFDQWLNKLEHSIVAGHDGLNQITLHQAGQDLVGLWNRSWQEAQILRQMLMLSAWLGTVVDHHLIVNLSEPFQTLTEWSTLASLQQQALQHSRIKLFSDTYYSVNHGKIQPVDYATHGWFGHQGAEGNLVWYQCLDRWIAQLGWT